LRLREGAVDRFSRSPFATECEQRKQEQIRIGLHGLVAVAIVIAAACSQDDPAPTPPDTTPPATVESLRIQSNSSDVVTLSWTAPGDDGMEGQAFRYEFRYSRTLITAAEWDSAAVAPFPPEPRRAGQVETIHIGELGAGIWYFAMKAADADLNWSQLSNVVAATVLGDLAPRAVIDLEVVAETAFSVTLAWTAPGSDAAVGAAAAYDLRHAFAPITEDTWEGTTQVVGLPIPKPAESREVFVVPGLERAQTYFFALRSADDNPFWSGLSNVASASTRAVVRLTNSSLSAGATIPDWSPDGETILFRTDWENQYRNQICSIPASGGRTDRLTDIQPEGATVAKWSPDGRRLALIALKPVDNGLESELAVMDVPGSGDLEVIASHGAGRDVSSFAWVPDGSEIAYTVRDMSTTQWTSELYRVPVSGGAPVHYPAGSGAESLDWSPDGSRFVFFVTQDGVRDLWVLTLSTGERTQITHDAAREFNPSFSPDGSRIAYASDREGGYDIWVMLPLGENPIRLSTDPGDEYGPTWSPDGRRIAYSLSENLVSDLWILYLD